MRPLGVELAHEVIEAGLLLQVIHAGRTRRFLFQRQVHTLVATVAELELAFEVGAP